MFEWTEFTIWMICGCNFCTANTVFVVLNAVWWVVHLHICSSPKQENIVRNVYEWETGVVPRRAVIPSFPGHGSLVPLVMRQSVDKVRALPGLVLLHHNWTNIFLQHNNIYSCTKSWIHTLRGGGDRGVANRVGQKTDENWSKIVGRITPEIDSCRIVRDM